MLVGVLAVGGLMAQCKKGSRPRTGFSCGDGSVWWSSRGERAMANYIEDLRGWLQSFGAAAIAVLAVPVLITLRRQPRARRDDASALPAARAPRAATVPRRPAPWGPR